MMNFNKYQKFVKDYSFYPNKGNNFVYPALGIAGEGGEVCDKIKKIIRDDNGKMSKDSKRFIKKELGDVLFYITAEANELNLSLQEIIEANIEKMVGRKKRGTLGGSGDER
mgnify:CR=1 FL=1